MEIQKLKKKLLKEELRERRKRNKKRRWTLVGLILLAGLAAGAGGTYYLRASESQLLERIQQAELLVHQEQFEKAADLYRQIHSRHRSSSLAPQALFSAGEILNLYLGNYQEAVLVFLLLEHDYPDSDLVLKAQEQVAEIYKNRLRDYNRAIVAYQKLLDSGAANPDRLQYEAADCYFRLNNFEQARIELESLVKAFPESPLLPEVHYRVAVTYSLEGLLKQAEAAYRRVIADWPESPYTIEARFGLASVLEEEERLDESLAILESLAGIYPNGEALAKKTDQVRERIRKKKAP
ncbi:hypothetical protein DESUT3_00040 [Desulfuromonas versatilis]|uniref:Tetratricopeptide repeat protein n=1 Tax=Desulfuromonas versatilis TaxID=2802975 RepID=A0ABM8HQY1_9BACT|nr:tetratricopeptide repeat protein [Desulfuromonas versatilis]BCR02935.1 hypothetical protein DESUT3_00040 [Desulfuromonas versatilis]